MKCCAGDCVLSSWTEWNFCSASCYGTQQRTRQIAVTPCGSGKKCDALFESRECNHDCILPCEVGDWGPWSKCSASCGGGSKTRHRKITQQEANGGPNCPPLWETACCDESNSACPAKASAKGDDGGDEENPFADSADFATGGIDIGTSHSTSSKKNEDDSEAKGDRHERLQKIIDRGNKRVDRRSEASEKREAKRKG